MKDKKGILHKLDVTFKILILVQFFLTIIQYSQGINYDNVTGLFGDFSTGDYTHFLFIIFSIYICKKIKTTSDKIFIGFLLFHIILYSVIAEVKIIFLLLPLVLLGYAIVSRKLKSFIGLAVGLALLFIGLIGYENIYQRDTLSSTSSFNEYLTGVYAGAEVNRFNFMNVLYSKVDEDNSQVIWGMGIGAAHPSSKTEVLQGPVYKINSNLKLDWFTLSYLMTEGGIIGTILYLCIYGYLIILSINRWIKYKRPELAIITLICLCTLVYNSLLVSSIRIIAFTWLFITVYSDKEFLNYDNKLTQDRSIN